MNNKSFHTLQMGKPQLVVKLKMYLLHKATIPQNDLSHAHTHTEEHEKGYSMLQTRYSKRSTDYITSVISGWVSMHWFFLVLNTSFAYLVLKLLNLSGRQLNYLRTVWLFWGLVLSPVKVNLGYLDWNSDSGIFTACPVCSTRILHASSWM